MKTQMTLTALMIALFPFAAGAADLAHKLGPDLENAVKRSLKQSQPQTPSPVREAKVRLKIEKHTFTQQSDGTYKFETTPVCRKDVTVNVYDVRPGGSIPIGPDDFARAVCDSTLAGKDVKVAFGGILGLFRGELFEQVEDFKASLSFVYVNNLFSSDYPSVFTGFGSRDVNATSFVSVVEPTVSSQCTSSGSSPTPMPAPSPAPMRIKDTQCSATMNEYFTAYVDVQD